MSLLKYIDNLLVPIDITRSMEPDDIKLRSRIGIIMYSSALILITALFVIPMRVSVADTYGSIAVLGLVACFFLSILIYTRKTLNTRVSTNFISAFMYILIPLRVYQTGGIYAPVVHMYILHCVLVLVLQGRKLGLYAFVWGVLNIVVFSLVDVPSSVIHTPGAYASIALAILILISIPIQFVLQEKELLLKRMQNYEKINSARVIMNRLTHEIGNSLNLANGYVCIYKQEESSSYIDKVEKNLKEIDSFLRIMTRLSEKEVLVETLDEYEADIKISKDLINDQNQNQS